MKHFKDFPMGKNNSVKVGKHFEIFDEQAGKNLYSCDICQKKFSSADRLKHKQYLKNVFFSVIRFIIFIT